MQISAVENHKIVYPRVINISLYDFKRHLLRSVLLDCIKNHHNILNTLQSQLHKKLAVENKFEDKTEIPIDERKSYRITNYKGSQKGEQLIKYSYFLFQHCSYVGKALGKITLVNSKSRFQKSLIRSIEFVFCSSLHPLIAFLSI